MNLACTHRPHPPSPDAHLMGKKRQEVLSWIPTGSVDECARFLSFMHHVGQRHAIRWQDASISTQQQNKDNETCVPCNRFTGYQHIYTVIRQRQWTMCASISTWQQDKDNEPAIGRQDTGIYVWRLIPASSQKKLSRSNQQIRAWQEMTTHFTCCPFNR